jgi:hypothetical protein
MCKRKLKLGGFICRCGKKLCGEHRLHFDHTCDFDWKGFNQNLIRCNNPKITKSKFEKI